MDEQTAMQWALEALAHKAAYWASGDFYPPLVEDLNDNRLVRRAFEQLAQELDERAEKIAQQA